MEYVKVYVHYRQNYEHMNIIYTIAMESKVHRNISVCKWVIQCFWMNRQ